VIRRLLSAASLGVLVLAPSGARALSVIAEPPSATCPSRSDVEAAIEERVPAEARGWFARYWVISRGGTPVQYDLRLELLDQRGDLRLTRELAVADDGCAAAAEGLALILERFFAQVAWTASVPLPELERPPEPPPVALRTWELQGATGAHYGVALAPALALDLRATFRERWTVVAGLLVQPVSATQSVFGGSVEMTSLALRASVRRGGRFGERLRLELGPELGLVGEHAWTSGLPANGSGSRLVTVAGLTAGARWWFRSGWTVAVEGSGEVALSGPAFTVGGVGEVLAPRRVQATALLAVSHAL
jgi:hypothetical protein